MAARILSEMPTFVGLGFYRVWVWVGGEIRVNYYPAMGMGCLVLRGQNLLPQTRELRAVEKVRHAGGVLGAVPVTVRFRARVRVRIRPRARPRARARARARAKG